MILRLLLDTHALLWWSSGDVQFSNNAVPAIVDEYNEKVISAAAAWEIATKYRLGKLPEAEELILDLPGYIANQNFTELPITIEHALRAGSLPGPIRDPFDRILIAQAITDDLVLVSNETVFDRYGVRRLW